MKKIKKIWKEMFPVLAKRFKLKLGHLINQFFNNQTLVSIFGEQNLSY